MGFREDVRRPGKRPTKGAKRRAEPDDEDASEEKLRRRKRLNNEFIRRMRKESN